MLLYCFSVDAACAYSPGGIEYRLDLNFKEGDPSPNPVKQLKSCGGTHTPNCNNTVWDEIYKTETKKCDESGCNNMRFETLYKGISRMYADTEYEACMIYSMDHAVSEIEKDGLHILYVLLGICAGILGVCTCFVCLCFLLLRKCPSRDIHYNIIRDETGV